VKVDVSTFSEGEFIMGIKQEKKQVAKVEKPEVALIDAAKLHDQAFRESIFAAKAAPKRSAFIKGVDGDNLWCTFFKDWYHVRANKYCALADKRCAKMQARRAGSPAKTQTKINKLRDQIAKLEAKLGQVNAKI
jgi:hypothetical protein